MEKLTKILTTPISISKFSLFKLQFFIKKIIIKKGRYNFKFNFTFFKNQIEKKSSQTV